ncbi:YtxH domain-containing protein [Terriglobus sp.]|uniref:YtxH domain-containing protein n=1 Tax=Terriglobus sp. TaxID=1889013 RepID=UPI003B009412
MSAKGFWIAFGIGVAAGAAVALLYAPQSGERTRKKLGRAYDEATDYLEDATDYLKDQAERVAKQSKDLYGKGVDSASDAYDSAAGTYSDVSDKLADAFSTAKSKAGDFGSYTAEYGKKIRSMV